MTLEGKVALVTGGGRGIGKAIALAYAEEGVDVCVIARTREQVESAGDEIRALGRKALVVVADVTDEASVAMVADRIREEFGRLDILVNNAGGALGSGDVLEIDTQTWIDTITLNAVGPFLVTQALLPLMIESGGGKIINVGSGMGHSSRKAGSAYNSSKAALWMFTRCLSMEVWQHKIEVNELIPGPVKEDFDPAAPPPFAESERVKFPRDVAPLALWLATQPDGGPTGQSFSIARRPLA